MPTLILTPNILALGQAGALLLFIIISFIICLVFLNRLKRLQLTLLQLDASATRNQDRDDQRYTATQEQIRQLQLAQSSTQTTVNDTRQETQHLIRDLTSLQHDAQHLMRELKTQQQSTQTFMDEWKKETTHLSRALRTTHQQGLWGELQLERVVEIAGMQRHCDFDIQKSLPNKQTPDMLIYLPNNRTIAVDSKANSQVYLKAMDCDDERIRAQKLKEYAREVRDTMNALAKKEYWKQLQPTIALVILFIPTEAMFRAAIEQDIDLLALATEKNVLLASPATLIALLKAVSYGWSQEERAQHVQQIVEQSQALHKELETWLRQWQPLKKAIENTTLEFNRVAKRYDTHILPLLRTLGTLDSTLLLKEKDMELTPLPSLPPDWHTINTRDQEIPQKQEPAQETASVIESDNVGTPWQERLTQPLKKLHTLFPRNREMGRNDTGG
ncbi:DNA recombination protein RmuC [Dictyobacter formicarum]|uniref:DNA recombination protein RmuC n=1 Tax=Dictyobacter formicarum TaxID=2778368 RepID=A0ABQ3VSB5_9CHLR|nr:DNA recombination protein RmuC [Dictyobacter formicarum]GHO89177.1 DNA recombination protein RmuC [Dictyobacter formicarum]